MKNSRPYLKFDGSYALRKNLRQPGPDPDIVLLGAPFWRGVKGAVKAPALPPFPPVEPGQGPGGREVQGAKPSARKTIFTILRFFWRAQYYAVEQITN